MKRNTLQLMFTQSHLLTRYGRHDTETSGTYEAFYRDGKKTVPLVKKKCYVVIWSECMC